MESGAIQELGTGQTLNEFFATTYIKEVKGIAIGQVTPVIHFLMSCHRRRAEKEKDVAIAKFVIHFDDGSLSEQPIKF